MKTVQLIGIALLFTSLAACGQTGTDAPKEVRSAFTKKFPDAKKAEWEMESESEWEAEFKLNGKEYSANFTTDGTWKETEYEIKKSEIPATVKNTLDKEFAGYDIEESEISETADGKVYEFELEKGETVMEVAISTEGKVVKKELKEEDEKEDND